MSRKEAQKAQKIRPENGVILSCFARSADCPQSAAAEVIPYAAT